MLALITGASSGLGVEFSRFLAMNGYDLIISARRENKLLSLKKILEKKYKVNVKVFPADLSDVNDVLKLASNCFTKEIDILINNAGFGTRFLPLSLITKISYRVQRNKFL